MNRLKSLRTRLKKGEGNKGFTLVELIVVIVILAILIGVTIGGIYKYVGQSRENTDKNNASSLQSVLSSMCAEEDVYSWAQTADKSISVSWKETIKATDMDTALSAFNVNTAKIGETQLTLLSHVKELCPDGLEGSRSGKTFTITIDPKNGNPVLTVECK